MRRITDSRTVITTDTRLEIAAVELRASELGPQIGARTQIVVTADRMIFDAPLVAPAALIQLTAREFIGGSKAQVDVSGRDGKDAPQTRKPKPPLGHHNRRPDGENGENGHNAGRIEVMGWSLTGPLQLTARGGEGGLAQPGGHGADGKPGRNGRNPRNAYDGQGEPGGDGGPAGHAGHAGTPGTSGDGGMIVVRLAHGTADVETDVAGGSEVPAATHGEPGDPGDAGRGGRRTDCAEYVDPPVV
mgnify:CR=1 FL=1|jgi:hypothetical protein